MDFYHVMMVHPKATIQRPPQKAFDTSNVIKADQFPSWHQAFVDKAFGVAKVFSVAANMRSLDTMKEWGEKLKRQRRPANLLQLPPFMEPKATASVPPVSGRSALRDCTHLGHFDTHFGYVRRISHFHSQFCQRRYKKRLLRSYYEVPTTNICFVVDFAACQQPDFR